MSFSAGRNLQNNINTTEAQTLSNKTLDGSTVIQAGATITTPDIISPNRLDVKKDTLANLQTYASSAANGQLVYATDSKKMFQVLDGALAEVGGGSGGINYIENSDAEVNADGWTDYANTTPGELPDDFGGSVAASWTNISASSSSPLRGSRSFFFSALNAGSGDLQGHGVYYDFTIDTADLAKKLTISFDYNLNDAGIASPVDGFLKVFIYDVDKSQLIRVNGEDIKLNSGNATHYAQFQTDATSTNYRLVIHNSIALGIAETFDMKMDNVQVGPREIAKGTIVTDSEDYTPVIAGIGTGTVSGLSGSWSRVGDKMIINVAFNMATNGTGSGNVAFSLPSGYTIDTSKLNYDSGNVSTIGSTYITGYATSNGALSISSILNNIYFQVAGSQAVSGTRFSATASVPIAGWSSDAKMSEDLGGREVVCKVSQTVDSAVLTGIYTKVTFNTTDIDTTNSMSSGTFNVPETGYYDIEAALTVTSSNWSTGILTIRLYKNGNPLRMLHYDGPYESSSVTATYQGKGSTVEYLEKGDTLELWARQTQTGIAYSILGQAEFSYMNISKRSSPQTILETETVAARYSTNAGQSISTGTYTTVVYEDLDFDTHNAYNTSTGIYTAPVSGYYKVEANFAWSALNATTTKLSIIRLYVGEIVKKVNIREYQATSTLTTSEYISDIVYINKGDEVEIRAYQDSGGSEALETSGIYNTFSIARIK